MSLGTSRITESLNRWLNKLEPQFGLKRPDQVKEAPNQGERVPPGQFLSKKFPVLTYGSAPKVDLETWTFKVFGVVNQEITLDWQQFTELDWQVIGADFHWRNPVERPRSDLGRRPCRHLAGLGRCQVRSQVRHGLLLRKVHH